MAKQETANRRRIKGGKPPERMLRQETRESRFRPRTVPLGEWERRIADRINRDCYQ